MSKAIISFENVTKIFDVNNVTVKALDKVNFTLYEGEILGIIGESGSGKSTIAKIITGLHNVTEGRVIFDDRDITKFTRREWIELYKKVQMVFQNATGSFNPRRKVGVTIEETVCHLCATLEGSPKARVIELLEQVGLNPEYAGKYPHELSGGECQRAAIARAMAVHPKLIICDEATSALDVSAQARIIALLKHLQEVHGMSMIFITHDLPLVSSLTNRLIIMDKGRIVEEGLTREIIKYPQAKETKALLDAVL